MHGYAHGHQEGQDLLDKYRKWRHVTGHESYCTTRHAIHARNTFSWEKRSFPEVRYQTGVWERGWRGRTLRVVAPRRFRYCFGDSAPLSMEAEPQQVHSRS